MEPLNYRERRPPADSLASANRQPVIDIDDVHTLAQGIVDTIRDPLLVLDQRFACRHCKPRFLSDVQDDSSKN